jgi:hypothetical protein
MNFDASFTGKDRLRIRLQAREARTEFFDGDPGFDFSGGGSNTFILDDLIYQFRAFNDSARISIGLLSVDADQVFAYDVPWEPFSNFADTPKSTQDAIDGSVAGFRFNISKDITFAYAYTAADTTPGTVGAFGSGVGVTSGNTGHYLELGFTPTETLGLYFQFGTSYVENGANLGFLADGETLFRGPLFNPADVDKAFAPARAQVDGFSFATNWEITPRVIFSGWVTFGNIEYQLPAVVPDGAIDPGSEDFSGWMAGFLFPDLFIEGGEGLVAFGQPIVGDGINERPFILDLSYGFALNDYITLRPGAYFVFNPNGGPENDNDPTLGVGALQAIFEF